jgi:hypothetical protein
MPTFKNSSASIWKLNAVNYQNITKDIDVPKEFEELDTTSLADTGHQFIAGFEAAEEATVNGMYDRTAFVAIAALAGTVTAFEYGPEGIATGSAKATANVLVKKVEVKSAVGELVLVSLTLKVSGGVTWGVY